MIVKSWMVRKNWGDQISKELVRLISGQEVAFVHANEYQTQDNYLLVGSILCYCDPTSIVWGSGFLSKEDILIYHPAKICAVRGPLSREVFLNQGVECPEIYGDPALLMPRYYNPTIRKKHKIGAVLHWGDFDKSGMFKNVIRTDLDTYDFIDRILECEFIVSSALHGLIVADAYGVPSEQMVLSDEHYQFKFDDYYASKDHLDLDKLLEVYPCG